MRIAIMLVILAFIALPTAKAAPINNSTTEVPETVQTVAEVVQPTITSEAPTPIPEPVVEPEQIPEPVKAKVESKLPLNKQELLLQAGIPEHEWAAVDEIVTRESGWGHTKWNYSGSGAYGLCQSLPASKMATAGSDYMTNPVTQLKWCNDYAKGYGGWNEAAAYSRCIGRCYSARADAYVYKNHKWW